MRIRRLLILGFALIALLLFGGSRSAFAQFDDLLRRVPGGANALVLIDVDAFYGSPMAVSRGWKETFERKWSEQPILLPPEAKRFVLASHLDPLNNLRSDWELAVVDLAQAVPISTIARAEGGYIDEVDSTPVVWTPSHAYCVQAGERLLGIVYPDDRQAVSRWLTLSKAGKLAPLSPYLKEASKRLRSQGQIVLAIDLENVAQPHRVERALKETGILTDKKVSQRAVVDAIASLRGVTLSIEIVSQPMAEARVDFGMNIRALKPIAKELVLAGMSRAGVPVADSKGWQVTVETNAIVLKGILKEAGLRRISSLLELPTSKFSTLAKESQTKDDGKPTLEASQRYFKSLERLINDLRDGLRTEAKTAWYEKTARKIDQMPILHVDEELLAFGAGMAKGLRETAEKGRTVSRQGAVAQTQSYSTYYDVGPYGGYGYYSNAGNIPGIMDQTAAASSEIRTRGMQALNNGLADMRRKMTKKYSVEF